MPKQDKKRIVRMLQPVSDGLGSTNMAVQKKLVDPQSWQKVHEFHKHVLGMI